MTARWPHPVIVWTVIIPAVCVTSWAAVGAVCLFGLSQIARR